MFYLVIAHKGFIGDLGVEVFLKAPENSCSFSKVMKVLS